MKKIETYFELEAGSITTKIEKGELKFLTVYRVKMNDYTLPKGHVEEKETLEDASKRETLEETGHSIEIVDFIDSFEYKVKEKKNNKEFYIIRRVYYFLGDVVGEIVEAENPDEKEGRTIPNWLSYEDALNKLTYDNDKNLIKEVFKKHNEKIELAIYAKNIYNQLLKIINNEVNLKKEILKLGIVGSINDSESVKMWSDLDILFIIKSDENGNINTDILLKLKQINKNLSYTYPNIEIAFLAHTYDDFEKYVSFGYLENYKFASFSIENDDVDFVEYIENVINDRALSSEIKKRYSIYHLRHFRFNLIRKVISAGDDKIALKMVIDKTIETMILYLTYFDKNIKGKFNRMSLLGDLPVDEEIMIIYSKALEKRKNWELEKSSEEKIREWLDNFIKVESFLLKDNLYNVPEELMNKNK